MALEPFFYKEVHSEHSLFKFIKNLKKKIRKTRFPRFVTPGIRKCEKNSFVSCRILYFFFYKANLYSVNGV